MLLSKPISKTFVLPSSLVVSFPYMLACVCTYDENISDGHLLDADICLSRYWLSSWHKKHYSFVPRRALYVHRLLCYYWIIAPHVHSSNFICHHAPHYMANMWGVCCRNRVTNEVTWVDMQCCDLPTILIQLLAVPHLICQQVPKMKIFRSVTGGSTTALIVISTAKTVSLVKAECCLNPLILFIQSVLNFCYFGVMVTLGAVGEAFGAV